MRRNLRRGARDGLIVFLIAGCGAAGGLATPAPTPPSAAPPSATEPITPRPTDSPSPLPGIQLLASEGTMFPGTYRTALVPAMTLTINNLVDLDCAPGYRCRGDIDVNIEHWVALEFGNVHGSQLDVTRVDKIPAAPGQAKLVDPPDDLAAWITEQPGITSVADPVPVVVGGAQGVRLDIRAKQSVSFGPSWGMCAGCRQWITVLRVQGAWIFVVEQLGPDNTADNFDEAVQGLQAVVDSIVWT
jgi:hypothetical protein